MTFKLLLILGISLLASLEVQTQAADGVSGSNIGLAGSSNVTAVESNLTDKSYFVQIRFRSNGFLTAKCNGALINPVFVLTIDCAQTPSTEPNPLDVGADGIRLSEPDTADATIGSRFNYGDNNNGDKIKIENYSEFRDSTSNRSFGLYKLEYASRYTPIQLSSDELSDETRLTVFGWTKKFPQELQERNLSIADSTPCQNTNASLSHCICAESWLSKDMTTGNPVVARSGGKDVLIGLRYNPGNEICGSSESPITMTTIHGASGWIHAKFLVQSFTSKTPWITM